MSASSADPDPHEHGAHKPKPRLSQTEASALVAMWNSMQIESSHPPPAPKSDFGKIVAIALSAIGLMLTVSASAVGIVQSNTHLYDKVESIDGRLGTVEKRQADNIPRIDAQINENEMQNDRIQSIAEGLAEERKQRAADAVESRKAMQEIMALIGKYADRLTDLDKSVAVMQAPGRRTSIDPVEPVERDAQVSHHAP